MNIITIQFHEIIMNVCKFDKKNKLIRRGGLNESCSISSNKNE